MRDIILIVAPIIIIYCGFLFGCIVGKAYRDSKNKNDISKKFDDDEDEDD